MLPSGESISVVMPAFNEQAGIAHVIGAFQNHAYVDEILVVDNNSTDQTRAVALGQGARVVPEPRQGYGSACIRALNQTGADIVVLVESDGTFHARDLDRMLEALGGADAVSGSRIHRRFNDPGADMSWYKILGNIILGYLVTIIYGNKTRLEDIGSTYLVVRKKALDAIKTRLAVTDDSFSAELYVALVASGAHVRQIPICYAPRIGASKLSGNHLKSLKIGVKHLWHVFRLIGVYRRARPGGLL